jgi:iron complex outermembrane receptor protein
LTERLTLIGGLSAMNAEVKRARNNRALEGKIPVNVPEKQARLYLEYALPQVAGLTLTGGVNYSGRRPVDAMNRDFLAKSTTYDAGLRYQSAFDRQHLLTLTLNVANLTDKAYWTYYRSGEGLLLGAPRVVSLTVKVDW